MVDYPQKSYNHFFPYSKISHPRHSIPSELKLPYMQAGYSEAEMFKGLLVPSDGPALPTMPLALVTPTPMISPFSLKTSSIALK